MSKAKIVDKKSIESILGEKRILSELHHPFIVNMIYSFQDFDYLYLVMEILNGGNLRYHLTLKRRFEENQIKFLIGCIMTGLKYIHGNNILHRDIKPENLVFESNGYLRITDFGIAKHYVVNNKKDTSGTIGYLAPEVLCNVNHNFSIDYYAVGIITYELMYGHRPYLGKNKHEVKQLILTRQAKIESIDLPEGFSHNIADFINKLIQRKPKNRLGKSDINEVLNHPWLSEFDWESCSKKKLKAPYVPKYGDNFDKNYCLQSNKIGTETMERYDAIMAKEGLESVRAVRDSVLQKAIQKRTSLEAKEKALRGDLRKYLTHAEQLGFNAGEEKEELSIYLRENEEILTQLEERTLSEQSQHAIYNKEREERDLLSKKEKTLREEIEAKKSGLEQENEIQKQQEAEFKSAEELLNSMGECTYASYEEALEERRKKESERDSLRAQIEKRDQREREVYALLIQKKADRDNAEENQKSASVKEEEAKGKYQLSLKENGFALEEDFFAVRVPEEVLVKEEKILSDYAKAAEINASLIKKTDPSVIGQKVKDESEIEAQLSEQIKTVNEAQSAYAAGVHRLNDNESIAKHIHEIAEKGKETAHQQILLNDLSNLVNGRMSGKNKITLEQYVQSAGFDSILTAANARLKQMSGGQFELYRHIDENDISGKNALALDVLDNYTGKKRPVSSLSGGESFKASLSLALGLSDRISSSYGGISIDALFIDEGFGTLDESSLNEAIEVLTTLSANGKLIGIISHRKELEERIEKQIIVEKAKNHAGSTLRMETGY